MPTVSIVYHSGTGSTAKLAEAVARGARSVPGIDVVVIAIEGKDIVEGRFRNDAFVARLDASDAIVFGSPTYMGNVSAQFKAFAEATGGRWYGRAWKDKLAAGFTVASHLMGDKDNTLNSLLVLAMQHGMLWVGVAEVPELDAGVNRLSVARGAGAVSGQTGLSAEDEPTGEALGRRVATATVRWASGAKP
jgi:NAD(P)H dehydrogenase (quinone)